MTRHRFDVFSFLAGGTAVAVAAIVLLGEVPIRIVDLRIAGPVLVLALGLALLLGGSRARDHGSAATAAAAGVDTGDADRAAADDTDTDAAIDADGLNADEPDAGRDDPDER